MTPNAVTKATVLLAASLALAAPALAGDAALSNFIGFSSDGRYFAFEEYGVQDGSGFAYSTIYLVDLPEDKWMPSSPFRAKAPEQGGDRSLGDVRADAMALAKDQIEKLETNTPAETLWLDGTGEGDGKAVAFSYGPFYSEGNYLSLRLTTAPATSSVDCVGLIGSKALGFALTFAQDEGQGVVVHDDGGQIPASRGCATDYRIYAVVRPFESFEHYVAIIAAYPFGFEGPDRRFIAVPLGN